MSIRSYKVVLLGSAGVGKTSLAYRIRFQEFPLSVESTIGCEFFAKTYIFPDLSEMKFLVWDTSGQEVFKTFTPQFCRGAHLALVFYDVSSPTNEASIIQDLTEWSAFAPENCSVLVVPTKKDLVDGQITELTPKSFPDVECEIHFAKPISSKSGSGIDQLVTQMAEILRPKEELAVTPEVVTITHPMKMSSCCSF